MWVSHSLNSAYADILYQTKKIANKLLTNDTAFTQKRQQT